MDVDISSASNASVQRRLLAQWDSRWYVPAAIRRRHRGRFMPTHPDRHGMHSRNINRPYHKRSRHHWMTVSWSHIPTFTTNIKQLNTEVNMRFYRWRHLPRVLYSIGIGVRTWEWSLGNIGQIELHKSQPKHLVLAFSLMNAMDTTAITSREDTDTYFATTPFWLVVWIWVVRLRWLTQQQDANNIYNKRIAWHSLQWNDMDVENGEVKHES